MSTANIKLHYYQIELVKKLSQNTVTRFNDLIIEGLESEHMNYHLKKLIQQGIATKTNSRYTLTDFGKDYFNLLDEHSSLPEKQPKTSIIIHAKQKNSQGQVAHLLTKRLRQPYFGKVGHPTGKVKFGEKVQTAAQRELYEETGLKAETFALERIYRKMRQRDGIWVQDVIFYIFLVKNLHGQLITHTPFQENFWLTQAELKTRTDLDLYDDFTMDDHLEPRLLIFTEITGEADGF